MPPTTHLIAYILLLGVCIVASITDIRTKKIPNVLTYAAIVFGLMFWAVIEAMGWVTVDPQINFMSAMVGMLGAAVAFTALVSLGGLGMGDMKLMAGVGAMSGMWQVVLGTTVYALLAAALMAIFIMFKTGRAKLTLIRLFGIALTKGQAIKPDDEVNAPTVPFAVAIAIGFSLSGAEHMLNLWQSPMW